MTIRFSRLYDPGCHGCCHYHWHAEANSGVRAGIHIQAEGGKIFVTQSDNQHLDALKECCARLIVPYVPPIPRDDGYCEVAIPDDLVEQVWERLPNARIPMERKENRQQQWERLRALSDQDSHGVLCQLWGYLTGAEDSRRDAVSARKLLDTLSRWIGECDD